MRKNDDSIKHLLRAAAIAGSQSELARQINASPQSITNWIARGGPVPAERCPLIEEATGGAVRCEQLNAKVRWDLVRARP